MKRKFRAHNLDRDDMLDKAFPKKDLGQSFEKLKDSVSIQVFSRHDADDLDKILASEGLEYKREDGEKFIVFKTVRQTLVTLINQYGIPAQYS